MILGDMDQARFVSDHHMAPNKGNVEVVIAPGDSCICEDSAEALSSHYTFSIEYIDRKTDPLTGQLALCGRPIVKGPAKIANGRVYAKTEPVPFYLSDSAHLHAVNVGLRLVNDNLKAYSAQIHRQAEAEAK